MFSNSQSMSASNSVLDKCHLGECYGKLTKLSNSGIAHVKASASSGKLQLGAILFSLALLSMSLPFVVAEHKKGTQKQLLPCEAMLISSNYPKISMDAKFVSFLQEDWRLYHVEEDDMKVFVGSSSTDVGKYGYGAYVIQDGQDLSRAYMYLLDDHNRREFFDEVVVQCQSYIKTNLK